ncbi:acyl-CoA dehydrogenase family protein [Tsukamurella sp. USMM236]|uniref:acyl-CoA dehydrogenase family protein n=1 Tax=Tsukamurella sp. USMM236 TaxID=3081301 RepID=UPI003018CE43
MPIDFSLSEAQQELQQNARRLASDVLSAAANETHHQGTPDERFRASRPHYRALVQAGVLRRLIPPPAGGEMTSLLDLALEAEEYMAVETSVPLSVFSTGLGLMPLLFFGDADQLGRFLPPFLSGEGEPLAGLAFSEVGGSANYRDSDPEVGFAATARLDGDEWVINGHKQFVPHASGWDGSGADLLAVAVRVDPTRPPEESMAVILVPGTAAGVTVESALPTVGHRAALVTRIRFDDVRVPAGNLLGNVGDGIAILETAFTATAALVGAFSVGVMRHAFDVALNFARDEKRGGRVAIVEHQNVGTILADMKAKIEAARYLTWKACDYFDKTGGAGSELAIATKIYASETAVQVVWDAMRLVGVESYTEHQPLFEILRDTLAYPLFDGGNVGVRRLQLQRMFASPDYDPLAAMAGRPQS